MVDLSPFNLWPIISPKFSFVYISCSRRIDRTGQSHVMMHTIYCYKQICNKKRRDYVIEYRSNNLAVKRIDIEKQLVELVVA